MSPGINQQSAYFIQSYPIYFNCPHRKRICKKSNQCISISARSSFDNSFVWLSRNLLVTHTLRFSRNQSLAKQWRKFAHFFINFAYAAKYHLTQCSPTKQCAIRSTKQWGKIHSERVFLYSSIFIFCTWKKTNHQLKKQRTGLPQWFLSVLSNPL